MHFGIEVDGLISGCRVHWCRWLLEVCPKRRVLEIVSISLSLPVDQGLYCGMEWLKKLLLGQEQVVDLYVNKEYEFGLPSCRNNTNAKYCSRRVGIYQRAFSFGSSDEANSNKEY